MQDLIKEIERKNKDTRGVQKKQSDIEEKYELTLIQLNSARISAKRGIRLFSSRHAEFIGKITHPEPLHHDIGSSILKIIGFSYEPTWEKFAVQNCCHRR